MERWSERREAKIKMQLTRMPATALFHSSFFIASSSSHQIRFFFVVILFAPSLSTPTSSSCRLAFFALVDAYDSSTLFHLPPFFFFLLYFLLLLFCFALSVTTRLCCRSFFLSRLSLRVKVNDFRRLRNEWYMRMHIISTKDIAIHHAE